MLKLSEIFGIFRFIRRIPDPTPNPNFQIRRQYLVLKKVIRYEYAIKYNADIS